VLFPESCLPFWWILFRSFLVLAGGIDGVNASVGLNVNVGVDLDVGFDVDSDVAFDVVPPDEDLEDLEDHNDRSVFGIFANSSD